MSVQQAISPHKQFPSKHSPKSQEKIKASPSKKAMISDLYGIPSANTSKKKIIDIQFPNQHINESFFTKNQNKRLAKMQIIVNLHPRMENGVKKSQASQKVVVNAKQQPVPQCQVVNGNGGNGSIVQSKQKSCFNQFCSKDKNIISSSSPQQEQTRKQTATGFYKQLKLEKTGEKVSFCDLCCVRYQERHFCYFCQQVYFDEYNIDEKDWIQCDCCDRWCHLNCEDEKIKKLFSNSQSDNVSYDCPRCRGKEIAVQPSSTQQQQAAASEKVTSTTKQTQNNQKTQKEKVNQPVVQGGTKIKKQGKIKEKEDKKQDQAESQIEKHVNGQQNDQVNNLAPQSYLTNTYSIQSQRIESIIQGSLKKGAIGLGSTNRDSIQQQNQNDQEIYYSLDNFKMKKNKIFQNQSQQLQPPLYQPIQPLTLLPNYSTIDDLLKSSGISVCLDESSIKSDLNNLKKMLIESSETVFQGNNTINYNKNKVYSHTNGQNYGIIVNQN